MLSFRLNPTFVGYLGLLLWSTSSVSAASVAHIPTFQILSIAFFTSFSLSIINIIYQKKWYVFKQPLLLWLVGALGIFGSEMLYISGIKYAPPSHVDLIYYTWPLLLIILSRLIFKERIRSVYLLSVLLSLYSIYLIVIKNFTSQNVSAHQYIMGYVLAFADSIVCSLYVIGQRYYKEAPSEIIGLFCGLAFIGSLIFHISFEPMVIPTRKDLAITIYMGLTTQGIAYFLWDFGVKKGNYISLCLLSYTNAVTSGLWLITFGMLEYSHQFVFASVLMSVASILTIITSEKNILSLLRSKLRNTQSSIFQYLLYNKSV